MDELYPGLYLGAQVREQDFEALERNGIESVVKLMYPEPDCAYPDGIEVFEHSMVDTAYHSEDTFAAAVETTLDLLDRGHTVLVHCKAGMSRSVAVATTVIARREGITFDEALERVEALTMTNLHPALEETGRSVLSQLSTPPDGIEP